MTDTLAADVIKRCRIAIESYDGRSNPAWSTGEKVFCALVLNDGETLAEEGYTIVQALDRLAGELSHGGLIEARLAGRPTPPPRNVDVVEWLKAVAKEVGV